MKIQFLGAARQVTGSCYFLEAGGMRLLIDCGMFQEREFVARNWNPLPVRPNTIDRLLLTHAHLDHCGLIPRLMSDGFTGSVVTTAASQELARIILSDAGRIQEEDAEFKRKRHAREGRKSPHPIVPLYTAQDAGEAMGLFTTVPYAEPVKLNKNVSVKFHDAGHILGSAALEVNVVEDGSERTVLFSGDVGQWDKPIIRDPSPPPAQADYVVMESTYGGRNHPPTAGVEEEICTVVNETVKAGGNIVIPTFAVERAQELMYHLARLVSEDRIPNLLAFVDSPMAVNVTEVFRRHRDCMDEEALELLDSGEPLFQFPGLKLVSSVSESKAINRIRGSCIILAGSGMCTAGRIKHHLIRNISRPECTILFVGYQAHGTLGRRIVEREPVVRIHGADREVKACVVQLHGLSAHADQAGLLRWIGHLAQPPRRVFLTHGEEEAAETLATEIRSKWNWPVEVPAYQQEVDLE